MKLGATADTGRHEWVTSDARSQDEAVALRVQQLRVHTYHALKTDRNLAIEPFLWRIEERFLQRDFGESLRRPCDTLPPLAQG